MTGRTATPEATDPPSPAPAAGTPIGTWARRNRVVVGVALLLVGVLAWLATPRALVPGGVWVTVPLEPDQTMAIGLSLLPDRPIEILTVRPATRPAGTTTVTFVACIAREPRMLVGALSADKLDRFCAETAPAEGQHLQAYDAAATTSPWDVVAVVDLGDQDAYTTEGFVVTYRDGLRHGRQTVGTNVVVHRPWHTPEDPLDTLR